MFSLITFARAVDYKCDGDTINIDVKTNRESLSIKEFQKVAKTCEWSRIVVTGPLQSIPNKMFQYKQLKSITLTDTIKTIGDNSFSSTSLTEFTLPLACTSVGKSAFSGSTDLKTFKYKSDSVTFKAMCFNDCINLESFIKEGNESTSSSTCSLGEKCFYNCHSLVRVDIPSGTNKIGESCFQQTQESKLTSIILPKGITNIPAHCFESMKSLVSINLDNIVSIRKLFITQDLKNLEK